jgi:hypothetical protein
MYMYLIYMYMHIYNIQIHVSVCVHTCYYVLIIPFSRCKHFISFVLLKFCFMREETQGSSLVNPLNNVFLKFMMHITF